MNLKLFLGLLGLFGALTVGVGEFLLHYSEQVLTTAGDFMFFKHVSQSHLYYGHFLAILGLPFYFAGYTHIYLMLRSGDSRIARIVLGLSFAAFSVGGIWIGSRGFIGVMVHLKPEMTAATFDAMVNHYNDMLEILVQVLRILILFISGFFTYCILKGGTEYKKWMALFNPIAVLLFFVLLGSTLPALGKYILPILMNITHVVIFSLSLYQIKTNLKS